MDFRDRYKKQIDSLLFNEHFECQTAQMLMLHAGEMEEKTMTSSKRVKIIIAVAAVVLLLTTTAFALPALLSPGQVAQLAGEESIAQAFESEDAVIINQTIEDNGYSITLHGVASGSRLSKINDLDVKEDCSYIVLSVARLDGTPISIMDDTLLFSPLVKGFAPWRVNAWTLNCTQIGIVRNGVRYFLYEYSTLEMFAKHEVYIAAYDANMPFSRVYSYTEDGTIDYSGDYAGTRAMFTLPLDKAKADEQAVQKFMSQYE